MTRDKEQTISNLKKLKALHNGSYGADIDRAIEAIEQEPVLGEIKAEIEEKYGDYDICEWFEDYDYEENNISEYQQVGDVSDILEIIDKYRESEE